MANRINYERVMEETIAALERDGQRPQLLLHACCAPCSSATLERLADHAVNISETVLDLKLRVRDEQIDELLTKMGENVAKMLQDILDAYTEVDDGHAVEIAERDATNDEIYSKVNTLSVKLLQTSPENTGEGIDYLKIANRLERIGDYITNIAEWIVYTKRGKIVELGKKDI